jgi:DNA-binding beta-propeller fold protein YncE
MLRWCHIWVANSGDDSVTKLRASDGTLVGMYTVGAYPQDICFDGEYVWVANLGDSASRLRASDGSLIGNYNVGAAPIGCCVA